MTPSSENSDKSDETGDKTDKSGQTDDRENNAKSNASDKQPAPPPSVPPSANPNAKSRTLIAVLGFLAPGLGHAFVGHAPRGSVFVAIPLAVLVVATLLPTSISVGTAIGIVGLVALTSYVASIVDAAIVLKATQHRQVNVLGLAAIAAAPFVLPIPAGIYLRANLVQAFKVPSGAMIPSVRVLDHLFVDMRVGASSVRRGDIIVFKYPEHPDQDFIKRVIAAPGDKLEVRDGHPRINDWDLPSCRVGTWRYTEEIDNSAHEGELFVEFLEHSAYLVFLDKSSPQGDYQGPFFAKPNEWWVLGDNRNNSHDSRMWFGGVGAGVPGSNIRGRAGVVWLGGAPGRFGLNIAGRPVAPAPELEAPLAKCLAERPNIEKTTPPARAP